MSDIKITGLEDLRSLLDTLPAKIELNAVRGGLRAGAKLIADEAKRLCPEGGSNIPKGESPGELKDSIRVSMHSKRGHVTATVKAGNNKAFYANMVEFGTAQHWIKPKNRKSLFLAGVFKEAIDHPGAQKHPFMRPAIDGKANEAVEVIANYMKNRIDKEIAKK